MDLDAIKRRLRERTNIDVSASLTTFAGEEGDAAEVDPEAFLLWLRENAPLKAEDFAALHATGSVHTTLPGTLTWADGAADDPTEEAAPPEGLAAPQRRRITKLGVVGRGGMAAIHVARDENLRRKVAYKVMSPSVASRPLLVRRFLAEAQITAQLEHPNIVPVYTIEQEDTAASMAYAMKLIDGETLAALIERSAQARRAGGAVPAVLCLPALLEVFLKVCDAVDYAHSKGVIHRDLKPDNIMVGPHREVYVMDWGLAKVHREPEHVHDTVELNTNAAAGATRVGAVLGTPAYMAPEQARGDNALVGPAADQYALGLVLFELITGAPGRPPLDGNTVLGLAQVGALEPIRAAGPGERLTPELVAILERATALEAADRYASVAALGDDLRSYLADEAVAALPETRIRWVQRWLAHNRETTFKALVALVVLIALTVGGGVVKVSADAAAARAREAELTAFLSEVGETAAAIDDHFALMEAQTEALAAAGQALLLYGAPQEEPVRFTADFRDPATAPADYVYAPSRGGPMSTRSVDVFVPPALGLERDDPQLRTLLPIRHALRHAHLSTRINATRGGADSELAAERSWREELGPIRWAMFGLANGVLFEMPGNAWDTEGYDPRKRPWFTLALQPGGPHWGNPFVETGTESRALNVPCSMGVRDHDGELLAVASVMTSFDFLIAHFMRMEQLDGVVDTTLVDPSGRVMVRTSDLGVRAEVGALEDTHNMERFASEPVLEALESQSSGHLESATAVFGWQRLSMNGWTFVVERAPLSR